MGFLKPFNFSRAVRIEEWVNKFIYNFEIMAGHKLTWPLPIQFICENLFGFIVSYREFKPKYSTSSGILNPTHKQIIVSTEDSENRVRFTFAHEIAHWLMMKILFPDAVLSSNEFLVQSREFSKREREDFANYTARAILIPFPKLFSYLSDLNYVSSEEIRELAKIFGVSEATLRFRVEDLKILSGAGFIPSPNGKLILDYPSFLDSPSIFDNVVTVIELKYSILNQYIVRTLNEYSKRKGDLIVLVKYSDFPMIATILNFPVTTIVLYQDQLEKMLIRTALEAHPSPKTFLTLSNIETITQDIGPPKLLVFSRNSTGSQMETSEDTLNNLENHFQNEITIHNRKDAIDAIRKYRVDNKTIVLAIGCFDEIDDRKIRFLNRAKKLGDILIVGVESENRLSLFRSDEQQKRGVSNLKARIEILSQFVWIDYIFAIKGHSSIVIDSFYRQLYRDLSVDFLAVIEGDPIADRKREQLKGSPTELVVIKNLDSHNTYLSDLQNTLLDPNDATGVLVIKKSTVEDLYRRLYGYR